MDKPAYRDFVVEIIRRCDGQQGFQILPRRWVVERTFGWMIRWSRHVRDYEKRIDASRAMILVTMGGILLPPKCPSVSFKNGLSASAHSVSAGLIKSFAIKKSSP